MLNIPFMGDAFRRLNKKGDPIERNAATRQARLSAALSAAPIGFALATIDGHWLHFNEAFRALLGYRREELARISFVSITHPDDAKRELSLVKRLLSGDAENYRIEKRVMDKRGRHQTIYVNCALQRDVKGKPEYFVYVVDMIHQKTESGNDADRFAASLLERMGDVAVIRTDPRGVITGWNTGAQRILGYPSQEIVGKNRRILYRDTDVWEDRPEAQLKAATMQSRIEIEDWRVRRDGTEVWVKSMITPYAPDGVVKGFVETIAAPTNDENQLDATQAYESVKTELEKERARREALAKSLEEAREQANAATHKLSVMATTLQDEVARRIYAEEHIMAMATEAAPIVEAAPATPVAQQPDDEWTALRGDELLSMLTRLADEKATGAFMATDGNCVRAVFFVEGEILSAASDDSTMFLAERLVSDGVIVEAQRTKARQLAEETQLSLGRVLLLMDAVTEEELVAALRRKIDDEIAAISAWASMHWKFVPEATPFGKVVPMHVSLAEVVRRAARRAPKPVQIVAATNGRKYHRHECAAALRIADDQRVVFENARAARAGGFEPCAVCAKKKR
jgi:PAS domain S-box-containing protein